MIRIQQLKLPFDHTEEDLRRAVRKALSVSDAELISYEIRRRSLDARKKPELFFIYQLDVTVSCQSRILKKKRSGIEEAQTKEYLYPVPGRDELPCRPVIAGFGPAGMFCGLILARCGYRPIILERGDDVDTRSQKVALFWKSGQLDPSSNVQFGEGGAGTFSDGKLNTAVKDAFSRNFFIRKTFVEAGADPDILFQNKPHIGTDVLRGVVKQIRREIISLGGEVRFRSQVTRLILKEDTLTGVEINGNDRLDCQALILAIGHSARDTFQMLSELSVPMEQKSFAVGVRIEHPQEMIDRSQYGMQRKNALPAADYKLTRTLTSGRGVYSFCMCPGGWVVNASSESGGLAVNGMSYHDRQGQNANSAMVVNVTPSDFGSDDLLAGVAFQRKLEKLAFDAAGGAVPVQLLGDFAAGKKSLHLGDVIPQIRGSYELANVRDCFPKVLGDSLSEGILACGKLIAGFDRADAVLSGVESRTSSPVRILRGNRMESEIRGLYPCGEGAGYAGGITSAAMDGMKVAETLVQRFARPLADG